MWTAVHEAARLAEESPKRGVSVRRSSRLIGKGWGRGAQVVSTVLNSKLESKLCSTLINLKIGSKNLKVSEKLGHSTLRLFPSSVSLMSG